MTEQDRMQIQVLIERDLHEQLIALANKQQRSMAAQVRWILKYYLEHTNG